MARYIDAETFWKKLTSKCEDDWVDLMVVYELLEEMETADVVERKTGKWIYYPKASGSMSSPVVYLYSVCSMCGREHPKHPIANYCPNCGSRMESE